MSKNVFDISQELMSNAYPGRGIILGRTPDNKKNVIAYFIMGRSENSRNRVFTETEDGIRTEAFDPSKMVDPSLIIYHPVRLYNGTLVVTNGDQTDTIVDYLKQGKSYFEALRTREFEPDAPNYTSRISGVVNPDGSYSLSILKNFTSDEYEDVLAEGVWQKTFKVKPEVLTAEEKKAWIAKNTGVTVGSDAFFPFGDNVERARKSGVEYIVQPGGSIRDDNVIETANKYGITMAFTGMRLFHH